MTEPLLSWNPGAARDAIISFVKETSGVGSAEAVPVPERLAVFDNDGTLWCEKPMPIQLDFILRRLAEMAQSQPELRERQPWKGAYERDYTWLGAVIAEHYAGDDTNVRTLAGGVLAAFADISVEAFAAQSEAFLRGTSHPTLGRGYLECAYAPMVELLGYLKANGFSNYIASGGGRDFMRPISNEVYGIPSERVIGSSAALAYTGDDRAAQSLGKPRPTISTTDRRSRYTSGHAPAVVRYSPPATPTARSRCSTSPNTQTSPPCDCSCCTTTLSASSTM